MSTEIVEEAGPNGHSADNAQAEDDVQMNDVPAEDPKKDDQDVKLEDLFDDSDSDEIVKTPPSSGEEAQPKPSLYV
jgi:hypothetical protein